MTEFLVRPPDPARYALSIITVSFQNRSGLESTVSSVLSQEAPSAAWELIVVDGGSDDGTVDFLASLDMPNISWSSQLDRGVYHAMNIGIARASGTHLLFLNSGDTLFDRASLATILANLNSNPAWMVAQAVHGNPGGAPYVIGNVPHSWIRHALGVQPHCHQASVFSADLTRALGGYSEAYGFVGDFDFIFRAGLVSRPLELSKVVAHYEGGGRSSIGGDEIPMRLHSVRTDRMQLGPLANVLDLTWTRWQQFRRRTHRIRLSLRPVKHL
jgi:glycosyltransferase involved in cell wall biosynthesis